MRRIFLTFKVLFVDDNYFYDEKKYEELRDRIENYFSSEITKEDSADIIDYGENLVDDTVEILRQNKDKYKDEFYTDKALFERINLTFIHSAVTKSLKFIFSEVNDRDTWDLSETLILLMSNRYMNRGELNDNESYKVSLLKMIICDAVENLSLEYPKVDTKDIYVSIKFEEPKIQHTYGMSDFEKEIKDKIENELRERNFSADSPGRLKHPCGDCIKYGDEECMQNRYVCEYSDKNSLKEITYSEGGDYYVIRKF